MTGIKGLKKSKNRSKIEPKTGREVPSKMEKKKKKKLEPGLKVPFECKNRTTLVSSTSKIVNEVRGWCAAHALRSFFLHKQFFQVFHLYIMGTIFSHPTHKDEILDSVKVWLNASTCANQTQSCFFTTPFFVNVGVVVRLKLNFILVKASIHPGQSKRNRISLLSLALTNE
jgi:hypothetical protein